jgi:hypothetical protein
MALETTILLAHTTGRTLVLPPRITLTRRVWNEENPSTYATFIDFSKLQGLKIVSMEDFIQHVAKPGLLHTPYPTNLTTTPTNTEDELALHSYLESACGQQQWNPQEHFLAFNITPTSNAFNAQKAQAESARFKQMGVKQRTAIPYDEMASERALYVDQLTPSRRLLITFYNYLYWADFHHEQVNTVIYIYTLLIYQYIPHIPSIYPLYTLYIPYIYPLYTLYIPSIYPLYTLYIPSIYPIYTLYIPIMCRCTSATSGTDCYLLKPLII